MFPRSAPARPSGPWSPLRDDLETISDILRVARAFFNALADDTKIEGLIDGYPIEPGRAKPLTPTAALVRQSLGLTTRRARLIVPAGRAAVFDDGMWSVSFVDAVTAAQGGGPGLVLYFVAARTSWQVIPGQLYGPRVIRLISFPTGWPEATPSASA
jgi:hypothetical protein